jgi:hypothetical protein
MRAGELSANGDAEGGAMWSGVRAITELLDTEPARKGSVVQ